MILHGFTRFAAVRFSMKAVRIAPIFLRLRILFWQTQLSRGVRGEYDITSSWYIVAHLPNDGNYITIDLSNNRFGRCYDSSLGRHGNPGYCPIIAKSFLDLLANLHREGGNYCYWLEDGFAR